ncbi:MAG: hypothetical protein JRN56_07560 [Nitrososphaerota archaeon]|nr:hypothetical protein [Nitrososphaerota archaeon]MDG6958030.1 hypothetical protein [Nitrososphaerota archaeon]MDG6981822.1 hypothetical protein [Nitrososphaerota archaeon]MDG6984441.1 hypothetical protein [Nitrososphaerota archaeon]MDG7003737.1 hypothetical protein [Nitrososphaerota archaeon]
MSLRCPSARRPPLGRRRVDIDVVGRRKEASKINQLFKELGYKPRERFNAFQVTRLIFNDLANARRVDIFLDVFEMCHKFDFRARMGLERETLPLADLLSTKLQIVEINEKDMKDILAILLDHEIAQDDAPDGINGAYIAKLCAEDWGVYKTFTTNLTTVLDRATDLGVDEGQKGRASGQVDRLRALIEQAPKGMRWKMRAAVGEKKRWYELPGRDQEVVDSGVGA